MNPNQNYFYAVLFLVTALFVLVFMIYGRLMRKPLVGVRKPETPEYIAFIRFVTNSKYLLISVGVVLLAAVNLVFSIQEVLKLPAPHTILYVAPIMVIGSYILLIEVIPGVVGNKD